MEKKFLTYDQQIEKLQNEKQLTISDVPTAIHTLEHISYYSLISLLRLDSSLPFINTCRMIFK